MDGGETNGSVRPFFENLQNLKKNTDTMTIFIPGPFGFRKNKRANYKTNFNKN